MTHWQPTSKRDFRSTLKGSKSYAVDFGCYMDPKDTRGLLVLYYRDLCRIATGLAMMRLGFAVQDAMFPAISLPIVFPPTPLHQQSSKPNTGQQQNSDDVSIALQMFQQRERHILQTIVQLHSRHQVSWWRWTLVQLSVPGRHLAGLWYVNDVGLLGDVAGKFSACLAVDWGMRGMYFAASKCKTYVRTKRGWPCT